MAKHDVEFSVPLRPLGNADIEFTVYRDGDKFGDLRVSKGAIEWIPYDKTYGTKFTWAQFDRLAGEHGGQAKR
jgi:hypothetical protein